MAGLGPLLVVARERAKMSQGAVAERLHIAQSSISRYEAGLVTPPDDTIRSLADLYGIEAGPWLAAVWRERLPPELSVGVIEHEQPV